MPRPSAASLTVVRPSGPPRLRAPASLSREGRDVFIEIAGSVKATHFLPSDSALLAAYAEVIIEMRIASERVRAEGMVDAEGKITSWFSAQERLAKTMSVLAHRLRLSPQGRSPTNPSRASRLSVYEEIERGGSGYHGV